MKENSRCAGFVELYLKEWNQTWVGMGLFDHSAAGVICSEMDCGSVVDVFHTKASTSGCDTSASDMTDCALSSADGTDKDKTSVIICSGVRTHLYSLTRNDFNLILTFFRRKVFMCIICIFAKLF